MDFYRTIYMGMRFEASKAKETVQLVLLANWFGKHQERNRTSGWFTIYKKEITMSKGFRVGLEPTFYDFWSHTKLSEVISLYGKFHI